MKKKYRFEFKDGTEKVYEMDEKQAKNAASAIKWGNCDDCERCFFYIFDACTKPLSWGKFLSITEIEEPPEHEKREIAEAKSMLYGFEKEEVDVENFYDSNRNVGSDYVEESTEFNSIYELYAWLSIEGNQVRSKSGSSQLFSLEDKFFCIYDTWKKVIPKKEPKTKKVKFLAYVDTDGKLQWISTEVASEESWYFSSRVKSEDKIITIEE